jgi:hypothetical protein
VSNDYQFIDRNSLAVFLDIPKGLTTSAEVLTEFLDPPEAPDEWFAAREWARVSALLTGDRVTDDDWQELEDGVTAAQESLQTWTELRDPATATDGYGTLSKDMRAAGSAAFQSIRGIAAKAERVQDYVKVPTGAALSDLCNTMWEYAACMAFELEASKTEVPVQDVLRQVNSRTTGAWSVSVTPSNVSEISIGSQRDPGNDAEYGADFWNQEENLPDTETEEWSETSDGGVPDGGGPEGSEK